jgi:hypothetical protein
MHINKPDEALAKLMVLLAPCFTDPPTAGAVVVINGEDGTEFFNINMESLEMVHTLLNAGLYMQDKLAAHQAPEVLQ